MNPLLVRLMMNIIYIHVRATNLIRNLLIISRFFLLNRDTTYCICYSAITQGYIVLVGRKVTIYRILRRNYFEVFIGFGQNFGFIYKYKWGILVNSATIYCINYKIM